MDPYFLFYVFILLWLVPFSFGECMKGILHKSEPGPESELFSQCTPWKRRSCCTSNTTRLLHDPYHHNFNINHCSHKKTISDECRRHFIQDLCFYECSPNIGHWLVQVNMKIRSERFYQVPLCPNDCMKWFNACRYDFTCSSNWLHGWNWVNSTNICQSECRTIEDEFKNAYRFCESVWDGSWKVAQNGEKCMTMWFDGNEVNPNDEVAMFYSNSGTSALSSYWSIILLLSIYKALFKLDNFARYIG